MMWHGFDIFMICTDIPNHPYKELGRDAEREKMWHESVRGLESGRETRLVRMWSVRSEYEMRRWDGETDRETKSAIPTLSDLGCEYVDQGFRAGDTSLLFVPVFASTSKCNCMQTNWSICSPLTRTVYDNINIWGCSGDDDLVKGMPRINWVMQIVEKKTQTDRISADRVAEEIRSALIRWLSQKHRSVINFKRELQYLTRMDGIAFLKLEE